jgi:hypothetical protein
MLNRDGITENRREPTGHYLHPICIWLRVIFGWPLIVNTRSRSIWMERGIYSASLPGSCVCTRNAVRA